MKLCDLHTHVLPGVDDGAESMEYALQMLRNAVASDVEVLAVTPHCNGTDRDGWTSPAQLQTGFLRLQKAAAEIPIQLVPGAEIRITEELPALVKTRSLPTLGGGSYLLAEFSPAHRIEEFAPALQQLLDGGYVPLIAHPERHPEICRQPAAVMDWLDMGCHLQLTGDSILGRFGRTVQQTARFLLERELVACVASDAHGVNHRSNFLLDVYDHLSLRYSKQYAGCLMYENPMGICLDDDI